MKIARFEVEGRIEYGEVKEDKVYLIEGNIFGNYQVTNKYYGLKEVKLLAPVVPGKVICVGLNFLSHIGEYSKDPKIPEEPVLFLVSPSAVIGPQESIVLPYPRHENHHEVELAVVIGKGCRDITEEEAASYILGYTCGNDVSDRDLQKKDRQWGRAKSYHTFKPLGPYIDTDVNPNNCRLICRVNGEVRQDGTTRDIIRNAHFLVSFISRVMTLNPGDVIMTGTPDGVGPLVPGDVCEIEIEGIGVLRNPVK